MLAFFCGVFVGVFIGLLLFGMLNMIRENTYYD
jgi:thiamine transporter ThiT